MSTINLYNHLLSLEIEERKVAVKNLTEEEKSSMLDLLGLHKKTSQKKLCNLLETQAIFRSNMTVREKEKMASRARDYEDIKNGVKTIEQVREENTLIRAHDAVRVPATSKKQLW